LANGDSSRFYQHLVKEKQLFTSADAYITGEMDEGMLIVSGNLAAGVSPEAAEAAIDEEIARISQEPVADEELQKVKNKAEAMNEFQEISGFNKAYLLSYFELLRDAQELNYEVEKYGVITPGDILRVASTALTEAKASVLYYLSGNNT